MITPEEARSKAEENFLNGCNCTQAVTKVFSDYLELDNELILKLTQPLGGGLCRQREICGAVTGMLTALGLFEGSSDVTDKKAKDSLYTSGQKISHKYREVCGSLICRELLGLKQNENSEPVSTPRTADFYTKRPCKKLCGEAAAILAEHLSESDK